MWWLDGASAVGLSLDCREHEPDRGADDSVDIPVHRSERRRHQPRLRVIVIAADRYLLRDAQAKLAGGRVGAISDGVGEAKQCRWPSAFESTSQATSVA